MDSRLRGNDGNGAVTPRCLSLPQNALLTTPPSTRRAAPVVAEASGLAT
jgi:hypothetical protein